MIYSDENNLIQFTFHLSRASIRNYNRHIRNGVWFDLNGWKWPDKACRKWFRVHQKHAVDAKFSVGILCVQKKRSNTVCRRWKWNEVKCFLLYFRFRFIKSSVAVGRMAYSKCSATNYERRSKWQFQFYTFSDVWCVYPSSKTLGVARV